MKTYFITLNWNTTNLLMDMIASVEATTPEPHEWIILDNGSDAGNVELLKRQAVGAAEFLGPVSFSQEFIGTAHDAITPNGVRVALTTRPENMGCIKGHNYCLDVAESWSCGEPYEVVMIDTDVVISEYGWLSIVRNWADARSQIGIVGLEHAEHEICAGAVFLDNCGNWYIHAGQTIHAQPVEGESVGLGLALLRWPVLRAGLRFDTVYRMYYKQDDDLCFQVRSILGLETWAYPIDCIHWGSGSLKANTYQCGDARGWDAFDLTKQANQRAFVEKWRWALDHRRGSLEQEAAHLARMKQVMADRRGATDAEA